MSHPTKVSEVRKILGEWTKDTVKGVDSNVVRDSQDEFIEKFMDDLDEVLLSGGSIGDALDRTRDMSSPYFWDWLDGMEVDDLRKILVDPNSEDINPSIYSDLGGFEAIRAASVDFLTSWITGELMRKWEKEYSVDVYSVTLM